MEKGAITIASLGRTSVNAEQVYAFNFTIRFLIFKQILQQLDQIGELVKARVGKYVFI